MENCGPCSSAQHVQSELPSSLVLLSADTCYSRENPKQQFHEGCLLWSFELDSSEKVSAERVLREKPEDAASRVMTSCKETRCFLCGKTRASLRVHNRENRFVHLPCAHESDYFLVGSSTPKKVMAPADDGNVPPYSADGGRRGGEVEEGEEYFEDPIGAEAASGDEEYSSQESAELRPEARGKRKKKQKTFFDDAAQEYEEEQPLDEDEMMKCRRKTARYADDESEDDEPDDSDGDSQAEREEESIQQGGGLNTDADPAGREKESEQIRDGVVPDEGQECMVCEIEISKEDNIMLICDGCDRGCHAYCLDPNGAEWALRMEHWYCRDCLNHGEDKTPRAEGSRDEVNCSQLKGRWRD